MKGKREILVRFELDGMDERNALHVGLLLA